MEVADHIACDELIVGTIDRRIESQSLQVSRYRTGVFHQRRQPDVGVFFTPVLQHAEVERLNNNASHGKVLVEEFVDEIGKLSWRRMKFSIAVRRTLDLDVIVNLVAGHAPDV